MRHALRLWRCSAASDTPARCKKSNLKFGDGTAILAAQGHHPVVGQTDRDGFNKENETAFGSDEVGGAYFLELHEQFALKNSSSFMRVDLVPKVAGIGGGGN